MYNAPSHTVSCWIYRSDRKHETYLYLAREEGKDAVPAALLNALEPLVFVMQLDKDTENWIITHDASTLIGNSGSCVVDLSDSGKRVIGLHFGGFWRKENYAHAIAKLQSFIKEFGANFE